MRAHQPRIISGSFEKRENVGAIEARDAAQRGDRGAHLPALESAEKTDGDAGRAGYLRQREPAAGPQPAEASPRKEPAFRRRGDNSLALQHVNNSGGIESTGPAQKNRALHEANIRFGKEAVAALGALRRDQTKSFPGTQRGGRNAHAAGHFADA